MEFAINKNKIILAITAIAIAGFSIFYATAGIFKPSTQVVNDLRSGLVGYWTFDGQDTNWVTNTTSDKSGQGRNGTVISMSTSTSPASGVVGQALNFDGSSDYIMVPDTGDTYDFGISDFTVSAWIKTTTSGRKIIWKRDGLDIGYQLDMNGSVLQLLLGTSGGVTISDGSINVNDGNWHHVLAVADRDGIGKLYIDGVYDPGSDNISGASASSLSNSDSLFIGVKSQGGFFGYFNGTIDEPRIYNRALSANEITELYNQGAKRLVKININQKIDLIPNGLVGYWTFDGPDTNWQTGVASDKSSRGNNGIITNISTSTGPTPGIIGQAINFDNTDDYFDMDDPDSLDITGSMAISAWIYPTSIDSLSQHGIVAKGCVVGSGYCMTLDNGMDNLPLSIYMKHRGTNNIGSPANSIKLNQWQHIVYSFNTDTNYSYLYINGELVGTNPTATAEGVANSSRFLIGSRGGVSNVTVFPGKIDEVRIYNRYLSSSEITELYNQGAKNLLKINMPQTDLIPSGLVVYWPFDGQQTNWGANTTNDLSGNGNTGRMYNMSTSTSPKAGVIGQALYFDGNNASFVTVNIPSLPTGNASFSSAAWINLPNVGQYKPIIIWGTQGNNLANWLAVTGGKLSHTFYGLNAGTSGNTTLKTNTWYHAAVTFNGTTSRIYLNGVEDGSANPSPTPTVSGTDFYVGIDSALDWTYTGKIDEVRVYNRVLSASEIMELYRAGAGL